jgi:hypothetical protein
MAMVNKEFIMEGIPSEHVLDSGIETLAFGNHRVSSL